MPAFTADDLRFLILWDLYGGSSFSFGQCNTESEENEYVVRNSASVAEKSHVTHLCAGTLCAAVNHPWQHGAAARAFLCLLCSLLIILNEIIHEVMASIRYSRESVLWIHKFLGANMWFLNEDVKRLLCGLLSREQEGGPVMPQTGLSWFGEPGRVLWCRLPRLVDFIQNSFFSAYIPFPLCSSQF